MNAPCRFAADPMHVCSRNDGSPLPANGICFFEAGAQLRESSDIEHYTDPAVYRLLAHGAVTAQRQERAS
jgi:hypothetical protein